MIGGVEEEGGEDRVLHGGDQLLQLGYSFLYESILHILIF